MDDLSKMLDLESLNLKHISIFSLIFFFLTITGTQTHEWAHYLVADYFNFNPILHYSSVSYKLELNQQVNDLKIKKFLFTLAGPLQTMVTGSVGLAIILFRRKRTSLNQFRLSEWFTIFLSLFWLRQVFNLITNLIKIVLTQRISFGGDEAKLSRMLNISEGIIGFATGIIGFIICLYVVFGVVTKEKRASLIFGGFIGSLISFGVWNFYLGKIILP